MFSTNLQFEKDTVTGTGDDEIGKFLIEGNLNRKKCIIEFMKVYEGAHSVKYSGEVSPDGLTIKGKYTIKGGEDIFSMSFHKCSYIDVKSGHWIGYYMQYRDRHIFSMNLKFETDTITGSGDDEIGSFSVEGTFDRMTGNADFIKVYHGAHSVRYSGEITQDGCTMKGQYTVSGSKDDFTMSINSWW